MRNNSFNTSVLLIISLLSYYASSFYRVTTELKNKFYKILKLPQTHDFLIFLF